jgi:hypothetical protein
MLFITKLIKKAINELFNFEAPDNDPSCYAYFADKLNEDDRPELFVCIKNLDIHNIKLIHLVTDPSKDYRCFIDIKNLYKAEIHNDTLTKEQKDGIIKIWKELYGNEPYD